MWQGQRGGWGWGPGSTWRHRLRSTLSSEETRLPGQFPFAPAVLAELTNNPYALPRVPMWKINDVVTVSMNPPTLARVSKHADMSQLALMPVTSNLLSIIVKTPTYVNHFLL